MKKFKSITVNEATFEAVDHLTRTLVPKVNLSKAQVVENLAKVSLGNKTNTQRNNDNTDKRSTN
tara:strand:+ start:475 stop:666 length:192 start_codon:yes stop_codon:yes gene_type:complete